MIAKARRHSHFEPKHLNFLDLASLKYPDRQWQDLHLKEQVELVREALTSNSFLVDPNGKMMKYWDISVALALVFTGIVTPYEVVFMKQPGGALFVVNRFIDLLFIIDMILQLFLKVELKRPGKYGTVILRDPTLIRMRYLKTWFLIDLISVLPFDTAMLIYESIDEQGGTSLTASLQRMKVIRCIRLLRLVKLIRILRSSRLLMRWQNYFSLTFAMTKFMKFTSGLFLASHWMACVWGLVGLSWGKELCDKDGNLVLQEGEEVPLNEVSWITTLYIGGKNSPDSPCVDWHVYIAALHWSVMTITSIGYGDIVPVREVEYIVGICCMLLGGVIWSYIIGCTCSILSNVHPVQEAFETNTDLLNMMMNDVDIPPDKRQRFREYLREAKSRDAMSMFRNVAQSFSPELRGELMMHISESWIRGVYYFANAPRHFILDLTDGFRSNFFARREPLHDVRHCLCILERGTIAHGGRIVVPGSFFQEDFIITKKHLQARRPTVSLTYSMMLILTRDGLENCLRFYPKMQKCIRMHAARLAFVRLVIRAAEFVRRDKSPEKQNVCLVQASSAFDTRMSELEAEAAAEDDSREPGGPPSSVEVHLQELQSSVDALAKQLERLGGGRAGADKTNQDQNILKWV